MATRQPINLQLKYSLEGTEIKAPLYDNRTFNGKYIKEELISIFDKHRGRLLIIGEAGSGKTTLLIQLAISLLEREKEVIPIILNIATWRKRFNSVEDWLNELLPQMGISELLAQLLIKENRLLPLFDGLDELAEEKRKQCLEAIGEYGKVNGMQYVICSRIVEYAQTVDAPVYCQIQVRPLTLTQIKSQLKEVSTPESKGMLDAIKKDDLLAEAIKTPFYLNTTQVLFSSSKVWSDFSFQSTTLEGRKSEIVQSFVDDSLKKIEFLNEDSRRYLSFLASGMNKDGLIVFELLRLQYSWSEWNGFRLSFSYFMKGLVEGLVLGLVHGLIAGTVIGLITGLKFGFVIGLVFGFLTGLMFAFIFALIFALENFLRHKFFNRMVLGLIFGLVLGLIIGFIIALILDLVIGLIFGLGGGFVLGLIFGLSGGHVNYWAKSINNNIYTNDKLVWSYSLLIRRITEQGIFGLIGGLVLGLIGGFVLDLVGCLILGLIVGLVIILVLGLVEMLASHNFSFIQLNDPYQRFKASARNLHFSILQHLLLRFQLYRKKILPLRLVDFLDSLSENSLMESDGAIWRFRHRILQDYFAERWKDRNDSKKEKP